MKQGMPYAYPQSGYPMPMQHQAIDVRRALRDDG